MEDLNKISSTRVGDNIHFYVNGQEDKGTVVKMDTGYVTVIKDDGNFQDIHINDTFFIKDILLNKTWNDMNMEERTVKLHEIHAYSPRFLAKSWQELPRELKVVLEDTAKDAQNQTGYATNVPKEEKQTFSGQATRTRHGDGRLGIDTNHLTTDDAYPKGVTQPTGKKPTLTESGDTQNAEFKKDKPKGVKYGNYQATTMPSGESPKDMETKKSNVEQGHYGSAGRASHVVETNTDFDAPDDYEGQTEDEKKEQFKHEDKKPQTTNKTLQEQLWEDWLNKETMSGGDSSPAQTSITTGTTGMYNAVYGKDGRIKGQEKDKNEEETEKDKEEKEKERKG
jgi:hypothetical protein